jgi:hypothetical protein
LVDEIGLRWIFGNMGSVERQSPAGSGPRTTRPRWWDGVEREAWSGINVGGKRWAVGGQSKGRTLAMNATAPRKRENEAKLLGR